MSKTPIEKLVDKYNADRDHYLSSAYNETQLRADFLDPFFELLGWDIKNTKGKPTIASCKSSFITF
jgi:predicted type IV restriction endonuclease